MAASQAQAPVKFSFLSMLTIGLVACSQPLASEPSPAPSVITTPTPSPTTTLPSGDLTQLFSRIWQVTDPSSAPGSLYIFLANGTLLETSCVETYRIATWTIDKANPQVLRVVEDGQLAFTAQITELTDTSLRLQQTLVNSNEQRELTLNAIDQEFVCPDLPR